MAGEYLGSFEVTRDYMASVGQRCTACRFRYLLVGVELSGDRFAQSQFGDGFYVLFAGDDLEQVHHVMESYCYIDVRFGFDCMYEVWHVLDEPKEPSWLLSCSEWCELVDSHHHSAIYHVHVANSGYDFVPVYQFGHDLFIPAEPCESPYDLGWRCDDVRGGHFGKLTPLFSAYWLAPVVIDAVYGLVSCHSVYSRCCDVEDFMNAKFDEWLEGMSTIIDEYELMMQAGL